MFFSAQWRGWVTKILCHYDREGVGHVFFEEPGLHFLRSPPPPVLFDQPLIVIVLVLSFLLFLVLLSIILVIHLYNEIQ